MPVTLGIFELLYKLSNSLFLTVYQFQQVICRFSDFGKGFLNKPPLPFTKGLRLGNMPQIRVIVDEELESVWTGKKTPQQALDTAVERGNQLLRRFEQSTKS